MRNKFITMSSAEDALHIAEELVEELGLDSILEKVSFLVVKGDTLVGLRDVSKETVVLMDRLWNTYAQCALGDFFRRRTLVSNMPGPSRRVDGECVLYWFKKTSRLFHNYALEVAYRIAHSLSMALLIVFDSQMHAQLFSQQTQLSTPILTIKLSSSDSLLDVAALYRTHLLVLDDPELKVATHSLTFPVLAVDSQNSTPFWHVTGQHKPQTQLSSLLNQLDQVELIFQATSPLELRAIACLQNFLDVSVCVCVCRTAYL